MNSAQVWTAIVTPFLENGEIDWDAFERILQHQIRGSVTGVVISGTTGESPTLSDDEKIRMVRFARDLLPKSIRVMAGAGTNNTSQSVRLSLECVNAGADSILAVTPPYNKPSPSGLFAHFSAIAKAINVPVCLYHVPGRTGQLLSATSIAELTKIPGVSLVKEASGDICLFSKTVQLSGAAILSGDDFTYLPSLSAGGRGVISVVTNVFPKAFVELGKAFEKGENDKALQIHNALFEFIEALFCEANPGPVKYALSLTGKISGKMRLPLMPVTIDSEKRIETALLKAISLLKKIDINEIELRQKQ